MTTEPLPPMTDPLRKYLLTLAVGLFDAAPGAVFLGELWQAAMAAKSQSATISDAEVLAKIAQSLCQTPQYKAIHPDSETPTDFVIKLHEQLGLSLPTSLRLFWSTALTIGSVDKGSLTVMVLERLLFTDSVGGSDALATLQNKVAVAEYCSIERAVQSIEVAKLMKVLDDVTSDPQSVLLGKKAVDTLFFPAALPNPDPGSSGTKGGTTGGTSTGTTTTSTPAVSTATGTTTTPDPRPKSEAENPGPPPDPMDGSGGSTMPGWSSEHMDPPPPPSDQPTMVWDNDQQAWVPSMSALDRRSSLHHDAWPTDGPAPDVALTGTAGAQPEATLDAGFGPFA